LKCLETDLQNPENVTFRKKRTVELAEESMED
jgi:hypothetical protein